VVSAGRKRRRGPPHSKGDVLVRMGVARLVGRADDVFGLLPSRGDRREILHWAGFGPFEAQGKREDTFALAWLGGLPAGSRRYHGMDIKLRGIWGWGWICGCGLVRRLGR